MRSIKNKIAWLTIFSIAMGFMETAIVIYLRKMYYPSGFSFPLAAVAPDIALIEFLREAATIIMLISIGIIAGKTASQKFAYFIYSFAIWDIFYYVFLKLLINWPVSFCTWDILFIIPVPWVGPVLAPCILSITMILLSFVIVFYSEKGYTTKLNYKEWLLFIIGSLIILFSFTQDYFKIIFMDSKNHIWTLASNKSLFNEMNNYIPGSYNWLLFIIGEITILVNIYLLINRFKSKSFNKKS
jgi:hypothetical protein